MQIKYKIAAIFTFVVAVMLLGIFLYLNNSLRDNTYQRIREKLKSETLLSKFFLERVDTENIKGYQLDSLADDIGKQLGLRVTIVNMAGQVLGDSDLDGDALFNVENHINRPEIQDALDLGVGESRRFSQTVRKDMLYAAAIFSKNNLQGVVRLSMPLAEIEMITVSLKRTLTAALVYAFIFIIIGNFLISFFISKPIREMAWIAKGIANGDLSKRINVSSKDEVGSLAKAFNYMIDQIRLRIDEVMVSKSRMEAVLLSMFEGVIVVDTNQTILLVNDSLRKLFNLSNDPIEKNPLEAIRNIEIQEIVEDILKRHSGVVSKEVSMFVPEERILLVHAAPLVRNSQHEGAVLVFHDITDLRKLERIRRDFVANVSHELRTPVASIKGYAETLLDGAIEDKDNAVDFVKIIHDDSDRLAHLISDLLDLSKLESNKITIEKQESDIKIIVDKVVKRFKKQLKKKSISLENNIAKDLPKVFVDESRITQVFFNLIDNAICYTPEKGTITVSAVEKNDCFEFSVTDTGIGIPEKDLPRVFERFYRVDKARSREVGGTGLGLSIVKHIILEHGGKLWAESILQKGSTFTFTILKQNS